MNFFYLHPFPTFNAKYHNNKHVVKMCIEYAQILSTAKRVLDGSSRLLPSPKNGKLTKVYIINKDEGEEIIYKATHINHPISKWARESRGNYELLRDHWLAILEEYTFRYGRVHACASKAPYLQKPPTNIPKGHVTPPPSCVPDDCKNSENPIYNYRRCYMKHKRHIADWKKRSPPGWFV